MGFKIWSGVEIITFKITECMTVSNFRAKLQFFGRLGGLSATLAKFPLFLHLPLPTPPPALASLQTAQGSRGAKSGKLKSSKVIFCIFYKLGLYVAN